mmetsp:Transcript_84037/g.216326  ORF Transcript_84037/g.216326 Transcript_84037/m.216326 type:complete len:453 (-) Transcript_84037:967-2325(-)
MLLQLRRLVLQCQRLALELAPDLVTLGLGLLGLGPLFEELLRLPLDLLSLVLDDARQQPVVALLVGVLTTNPIQLHLTALQLVGLLLELRRLLLQEVGLVEESGVLLVELAPGLVEQALNSLSLRQLLAHQLHLSRGRRALLQLGLQLLHLDDFGANLRRLVLNLLGLIHEPLLLLSHHALLLGKLPANFLQLSSGPLAFRGLRGRSLLLLRGPPRGLLEPPRRVRERSLLLRDHLPRLLQLLRHALELLLPLRSVPLGLLLLLRRSDLPRLLQLRCQALELLFMLRSMPLGLLQLRLRTLQRLLLLGPVLAGVLQLRRRALELLLLLRGELQGRLQLRRGALELCPAAGLRLARRAARAERAARQRGRAGVQILDALDAGVEGLDAPLQLLTLVSQALRLSALSLNACLALLRSVRQGAAALLQAHDLVLCALRQGCYRKIPSAVFKGLLP